MKAVKIGIMAAMVILIGSVCFAMAACSPQNEEDPPVESHEIRLVTLSEGGGFGTMFDTLPKGYTVYNDKTMHVSYDLSSLKENGASFENINDYMIDITDAQYEKISAALANAHLDTIEVESDQDVLDGSSQTFITYDENGGIKRKVGGYMVKNKELNELRQCILDCVDDQQDAEIKAMGKALEEEYENQ